MPRKTAELWLVFLGQECEGKAEPYRNEWRELNLEGGARVRIPPNGKLDVERELLEKPTHLIWRAHGISTSGKPGAPCVAISRHQQYGVMFGDIIGLDLDIGASCVGTDGFGLWSLIDAGEFARQFHLMIAALPPVWKVKKAPKA